MATKTTPIFPTQGQVSCFDYVDTFFKEKVPLIHRRKAFFTYVQQEGQDATQLREELRNLADLGDIAGMDLPGALCLMYSMSIRDVKLQENSWPNKNGLLRNSTPLWTCMSRCKTA